MFKTDAIKYFGNLTKLAEAAGVKLPSASAWGDLIPERRAARLDRVTNGALRYDPVLYQRHNDTRG
ncbi:Cro/CI family transcriptional regulator [Dickeya fangzhongdai]|uniref:Transcriptional regulator n=1 Tax=Dickeya fangzhongdai TaxID=1778540 RepID=A0A2K8QP81_9GAMM|nr:Cro/CI family transcriptional regulator [Dickeya fangzhongdai]ATZ95327.1 hypothetical protein CVE23_15880 [Dickeya fangzhongdai]QOH48769.1 hypothetical protein DYD82_15950 [Dickeya fangzhongdai]QOH53073.1 hypothetical protein DYD83_15950 [Dickeya fangzhongdai]GGC04547.1 repressor protein of division inhibition gene dicB [Dickeya fangzhongdai]